MSSTHPPAPPLPNTYWLPGHTLLAGEYPGDDDRAQAREKLSRLLDAGIRTFVDLTAPEDPLVPYAPFLLQLAEEKGIDARYQRLAIRDMGVPRPALMTRILDVIDVELAAGRRVYVHCWGGVGRTGTVVGCHLVRGGVSGGEALAAVARHFATMSAAKRRNHPEGSPQTAAQRAFVECWSERPPARGDGAISRHARYRGCLLGGAVGDALGAPVEFLGLAAIRRAHGPGGIAELHEAYGRVGAITDDTQMTLFTAEGVLRARARWTARGICAPSHLFHHAYLRWLRTQDPGARVPEHVLEPPSWLLALPALHHRRAPGTSCLSALRSGRCGTVEEPVNDSKGCGGVMRAAPAGLVNDADSFQLGCEAAAVTHGHPTGWLSAGTLALIVRRLVDGDALDAAVRSALERLRGMPGHEETTAALDAALRLHGSAAPTPERVESLGGGWIAEEALAIGVYSALAADGDFAAGVRLAVNHSGDSDSTGAIAGNLLGAMLGVDAIPARWLEQLELRDAIASVADDLHMSWTDGPEWWERYPGV